MQSMRNQQNGSEMGDIANKAEQLAGQQQDFETAAAAQFRPGPGQSATAQQMVDEKQQMLDEYNQLQKQMQQAARDLAGYAARRFEESSRHHGQEPAGRDRHRMEWTEDALAAGHGAVCRHAGSACHPVAQ